MSEDHPTNAYRSVAARFTHVVEGADDAAAWDRPTPVAGWNARDVVRHLVDWLPPFLSAGAGVELSPGPSVESDPAGAWRALDTSVQNLLDDPGSENLTFSNPHTGEMALPLAIDRFFTGDVFMHTWDLAKATGQDDTLDADLCARMLEGMIPMDEMMRASGQFGPRIEVPADADAQTRLMAFIGRDPNWTAPLS